VLLYEHGFVNFNMGYASALAVLLLGAAFVVVALILLNSRRWVHYAGAAR
jgi:multiple sugar transport system permease protein